MKENTMGSGDQSNIYAAMILNSALVTLNQFVLHSGRESLEENTCVALKFCLHTFLLSVPTAELGI